MKTLMIIIIGLLSIIVIEQYPSYRLNSKLYSISNELEERIKHEKDSLIQYNNAQPSLSNEDRDKEFNRFRDKDN